MENCLTLTNPDALTIETMHDKLKHWHEKIKKGEWKRSKEKELAVYGKQSKGRCHRYGKIGHKSTDPKCPENKIKGGPTMIQWEEENCQKFLRKCLICDKTGHKVNDCPELFGCLDKAKQSLDKRECNDLIHVQ